MFSSDEEDEKAPDKATDEEMGNDQHPLHFPSEESSSDEDRKDADPEWKLLKEQAENLNDGNDEVEDRKCVILKNSQFSTKVQRPGIPFVLQLLLCQVFPALRKTARVFNKIITELLNWQGRTLVALSM